MTDELKPVRCGCGGEAILDCYLGDLHKSNLYYIYCAKCDIRTSNYLSEAEAVESWNRAMGAGKSEIAITKGYWMTTYDVLHCSVCPHCGTRLIT